ncbi:hypothetical protein VY88_28020 [Azospirillum thiophilum]|nr:hypothetical protein VY88_28020 [Azospirillum thiophilum]
MRDLMERLWKDDPAFRRSFRQLGRADLSAMGAATMPSGSGHARQVFGSMILSRKERAWNSFSRFQMVL